MSNVNRYPLAWPLAWRRTSPSLRRHASFRSNRAPVTVYGALGRLQREMELLGAFDVVLSTNVELRLDGFPRSNIPEPTDPGAAVYFTFKKRPTTLACDKWRRVADNITAIAQHIDALRRIDRYGVGTLSQVFAGYAALPPAEQGWRAILGLEGTATLEDVEAAYLNLARKYHPDIIGTDDEMKRVNRARDEAREELVG